MSKYSVVMEEYTADGDTLLRRMLCARFVALGDAVAYIVWRRDTDTERRWTWKVENSKGHVLHTARQY